MKDIAIIILNYNTWQDTINEIEHVHNMFSVDYGDFIVVDNKSINNSYKKLSEYKENYGIVLIESEINGGYAKGNNIGLRYAYDNGYKYAFVMNNDIEFIDKNTINILINCLSKDKMLAIVNTDIMSPTGKIFNRDSVRPSFFDMTFGMFNYIKKGRQLQMIDDTYAYVYRPQGCCMLVDINKLKDIDNFDEYTFLYNEEIILAERLLKKGYKCGCVPGIKTMHHVSKTIKSSIIKNNIIDNYVKGYKYYLLKYRKFAITKMYIAIIFLKFKLLNIV